MSWIRLEAKDGHAFKAWQAQPAGQPRGAIVVLQEIFGVNAHIRSVCDRYAAQGWLAVAPALFDRAGPGLEFGYDPEGMTAGRAAKAQVSEEAALADVQAAVTYAQRAGKVAVVGFCWGGTLTWLAAAHLQGVACGISYYGTSIHAHRGDKPRVPVLLHFGDADTHIPPQHVQEIAAAQPQVPLYRYPAGHGFNCDVRASYDRASAELAAQRTQAFLEENLCR